MTTLKSSITLVPLSTIHLEPPATGRSLSARAVALCWSLSSRPSSSDRTAFDTSALASWSLRQPLSSATRRRRLPHDCIDRSRAKTCSRRPPRPSRLALSGGRHGPTSRRRSDLLLSSSAGGKRRGRAARGSCSTSATCWRPSVATSRASRRRGATRSRRGLDEGRLPGQVEQRVQVVLLLLRCCSAGDDSGKGPASGAKAMGRAFSLSLLSSSTPCDAACVRAQPPPHPRTPGPPPRPRPPRDDAVKPLLPLEPRASPAASQPLAGRASGPT